MKNKNKKQDLALKILKAFFALGCLSGFLYQTFGFLSLYWTYPTVVDIQHIDPSYLDIPAFTICNPIGEDCSVEYLRLEISTRKCKTILRYNFTALCSMSMSSCMKNLPRFSDSKGFQIITYTKFMQDLELTSEDHEKLRVKLEDYMKCTIEFAGVYTPCDLTNVMGPMYTKDDMPQYCYAIYSLWSQPNKKRKQIAKGSVMHFKFELYSSLRPDDPGSNAIKKAKYNLPETPSVQIAVHSPYFLPSPFLDGMGFSGGRAYELRLKMDERHLLPPPYQTNCTDYMKTWAARGGRGPINQMRVLQECRINKTYEKYGCIPVSLDYPHTYKLCKSCPHPNEQCNILNFAEECGKLAAKYTQPCEALTYPADKEDRFITTLQKVPDGKLEKESIVRKKILAHDCDGISVMTKDECLTIDVYILFDRFQITSLTYNPKFERLEFFSMIGGYMGMWLGISLLTMYDFIGTVIVMVKTYFKKKREKTKIHKVRKEAFHRGYEHAPKFRNEYFQDPRMEDY